MEVLRQRELDRLAVLVARNPIEDLRLDRLDVIHAGTDVFPLTRHIRAVPLTGIEAEVDRCEHTGLQASPAWGAGVRRGLCRHPRIVEEQERGRGRN